MKLENKLIALLELQKLDLRLTELESTRGDLPQKVVSSRDEIEKLEQILKAKKEELKEVKIRKSVVVLERNHSNSKLEQYQEQLYRVTSNREYDAITTEIESTKENIDTSEIQEIEYDDKAENLISEISELENQYSMLKTGLEFYEKDLQKKLSMTNQEEERLKKERESLIPIIERVVYSSYERVRKAKSVAVVAIQRNACGGCYNSIPPQRVLEIRQRRQFITCEHCGRILVWQNSQAAT